MPRFLLLPLFLLSSLVPFLVYSSENDSDEKLPSISGIYQFSFDNISLPKSEALGLLGGNYLIQRATWYTGLGIYGAVTGDRGGFFTGGIHLGKYQVLTNNYFIDGNVFFGGGGGGSAPQGGGLMLRAALGLGKRVSVHRFFVGVSRVTFPNGGIKSNQLSFAYGRSFSSLHFSGWDESVWKKSGQSRWTQRLRRMGVRPQQVSLQISNYYPRSPVIGRDAKAHEKTLSVFGIRASQKINSFLWGEFETGGAMSGGIDGFAQVLGGFSFKRPLTDRFVFSSGWLVGAAGGGNVDTAGGVITRIYSGVEVMLTPRWSSYLQVGYISTVEKGFSAATANLNIVYNFNSFERNYELAKNIRENKFSVKWRKLRIRPGLQKYTFFKGQSRKGGHQKNIDIDLTSLKLDAFLNSYLFITGQALGAFKGKAGGYAAGLVGPGVQFTQRIGVELLFGVAGGGGVAVGSGKIMQPMLNLELPYNNEWSAEVSIGYIKALDNNLSSFVFNTGLVYRFSQVYY